MENLLPTKFTVRGDRMCKALTGSSIAEFKELVILFEPCLIAYRHIRKPTRMRKLGGGIKGALPTTADKLFFILMYLKCYPTFDVMSFLCHLDRGKCCKWVKFLLPVLEMTLKRSLDLPKRKIRSVEEFMEAFPEAKDVFIDGTERRVQRPKNKKEQNKLYSGKKKATTRKNVVITNEHKKIMVLSKTKSGRRHDKRIVDKEELITGIPPDVSKWTDTGFQGLQKTHQNVIMPMKSSKNKPLTQQQKDENRLISSIRVVNEHAIAGIKRLKAASDIYRNKLANMDDTFMLLSAGLWNFHLKHS
jgi:hypothetical protein